MSQDDPKTPSQHDDGWGDAAKIKEEADQSLRFPKVTQPAQSDPLSNVGDEPEPRVKISSKGSPQSTQVEHSDNIAKAKAQVDTTDWGDRDAPAAAEAATADVAPTPATKTKSRKSRKLTWFVAVVFLAALATAGFFSWKNSRVFKLVCDTDTIIAKRGTRWPTGEERLKGKAFEPIPIAPENRCTSQEFSSLPDLEIAFLNALLGQAEAHLLTKSPAGVHQAEQELSQALMLTRTPERASERRRVETLFSDVDFWAASSLIKEAKQNLILAQERFEQAKSKNPSDAHPSAPWSDHVKQVIELLEKDPTQVEPEETIETLERVPGDSAELSL